MKSLEVYRDVVQAEIDDDGDDSLACKTIEEQVAETSKIARVVELRNENKAVYKKLCIYVFIMGTSGFLAYKYRDTKVADICQKFVHFSLAETISEALKLIPEAVDVFCS